jgi:hypothetical protein
MKKSIDLSRQTSLAPSIAQLYMACSPFEMTWAHARWAPNVNNRGSNSDNVGGVVDLIIHSNALNSCAEVAGFDDKYHYGNRR